VVAMVGLQYTGRAGKEYEELNARGSDRWLDRQMIVSGVKRQIDRVCCAMNQKK
jgi:hypothetical protein